MLIDEPAVLVPRRFAQPLLELAVAEAQRRDARGWPLSDEMRRLLGELARAARDDRDRLVPSGSVSGAVGFRGGIVGGVTTRQAAFDLGITDRAVRKAIAAGRLRGEKQSDGSWLVELPGGDRR